MRRTLHALLAAFFTLAAMMSGTFCPAAEGAGDEIELDSGTSMPAEMRNWGGPQDDGDGDLANPKIDPNLLMFVESTEDGDDGSITSESDLTGLESFEEERAHVQVLSKKVDLEAAKSALLSVGGEISGVGDAEFGEGGEKNEFLIIQGWVPPKAIEELAKHDGVAYVRLPLKALMIREADDEAIAASFDWSALHKAGFLGNGVKVGVIDSGFAGACDPESTDCFVSQARCFADGEPDNPFGGDSGGAESLLTIHEIAPDASLYAARVETLVDVQEAISWLVKDVGVDVVRIPLFRFSSGDASPETAFAVSDLPDSQAYPYWATPDPASCRKLRFGPFENRGDGFHLFAPDRNVEPAYLPEKEDSELSETSTPTNLYLRWENPEDPEGAETDLDLRLLKWDGTGWRQVAESGRAQPEGFGPYTLEYVSAKMSSGADSHGYAVFADHARNDLYFEIFASQGNAVEKTADGDAAGLTSSHMAGIAALIAGACPSLSTVGIRSIVDAVGEDSDMLLAALSGGNETYLDARASAVACLEFPYPDLGLTYCQENGWDDHDWWTAETAFSTKRIEVSSQVAQNTYIRILVNGSTVAQWYAEVGPNFYEENIAIEIEAGDTITYGFGNVPRGCVKGPFLVKFCDSRIPTTGSIQAAITPQNAIDAGAKWCVDGGTWRNSGETESGLSEGNHTVSYKTLYGWDTPAEETVPVNIGETATVSGSYTRQTGSLRVTIEPQEAINAGAKWRVDGGTWKNSGETVSGLYVGTHTVSYNSVSIWDPPADESLSVSKNATTTTFGTYGLSTGLKVTIEPQGAVTAGAMWKANGGEWMASGSILKDLNPGEYTVSFKTIPDWTAPLDQTVSVSLEEVSEATGNYVDRFFPKTQILPETKYGKISDIESFEIDGETYIGVMNSWDGLSESPDACSYICKWNGTTFEIYQALCGKHSATDCESLPFDDGIAIAISSGKYDDWNGSYFYNGVYVWYEDQFDYRFIYTGTGTTGFEGIPIGDYTYLISSNHCYSTMEIHDKFYWKIFLDGNQLGMESPIKKPFRTKGTAGMDGFKIEDETYLAVAHQYESESCCKYDTESAIYKWNGSDFEYFQSVATSGAFDFEHFEIDGETFLAVANSSENGDPEDTVFWEKSFGGGNSEEGNCVAQTDDGGYVVAGYKNPVGTVAEYAYLVKTDASGNELWSKTFGGNGAERGYSVRQTGDGGYVIVGETDSFGAGSFDVYLVKTNASGNEVWSKTFGGNGAERGYSVQQTGDGGYVVAGTTESFGAGSADVYLIKTDASGNQVWNKTFGGEGEDYGSSVQQTEDGGYIVCGQTNSVGAGASDFYLIKTDASGNEVWSKTYGGEGNDFGQSVRQTEGGGYVLVGSTNSFELTYMDVYLVKTDASGNEVWSKTFGGDQNDYGKSVWQTKDGGYAIAGETSSFGAGINDVYLIRTDALGHEIWVETFGGTSSDSGAAVRQTSDGGFIVAGQTFSIGAGNADVYLAYYKPPEDNVNIDSQIFKWNGSSFQPFQSIPTSCARGFTHFEMNEEDFLFVANEHDGESSDIDSKLYRWNGTAFSEVESIPTHSARKAEFFSVGGRNCLAIPYYDSAYPSVLLKTDCIDKNIFLVEEQGSCGGKEPCYSNVENAMNGCGDCSVIRLGPGTYNENVVVGEGTTLEIGWDKTFSTTAHGEAVVINGGP